ncbi:MAG: hypothetical protein KJ066_07010 [Acidobacteria bacterium]|nr:hypothetical protein [Acidobacteriota bacterium]
MTTTHAHEGAAESPAAPTADAALGSPPQDPTGGASLDKVRDILFGVQMREVDRRFARLEERLVKETSDLKDEVRRRLEALEQYARAEVESLADRIRVEHDGRAEAQREMSRELRETAASFERRTAALDEQGAKAQRELRQQMLEQHQRLTDDLRQKVDEILSTLAREARELRDDKADRRLVASLLTEMAMRLNNELSIPGLGDTANG